MPARASGLAQDPALLGTRHHGRGQGRVGGGVDDVLVGAADAVRVGAGCKEQ